MRQPTLSRPAPSPLSVLFLVPLPIALALLPGCSRPAARAAPAAVPVVVAVAEQRDVPVEVTAIGTVEPNTTVTIRPQTAGVLARVHVREGDEVAKGDLLFSIDPRALEAEVRRAEAALERDLAQLDNARTEERRFAALFEQQLVSQGEYDRARTAAASYGASVNVDRAALDDARVQLGYTRIRAPIAGRLGRLLAHAGNVVKENDTTLVTINEVRPVKVGFALPEARLPEVRHRLAEGTLRVTAAPKDGAGPAAEGRLEFVDNAVDRTTGTILLKGLFPNEDGALWPGQFVEVRLTLETRTGAIVVPAPAVQAGQKGEYVFVVKRDGKAESRAVTTGPDVRGLTVIEQGVAAGETVVTDGHLRIVPGSLVAPRPASAGELPAEGK